MQSNLRPAGFARGRLVKTFSENKKGFSDGLLKKIRNKGNKGKYTLHIGAALAAAIG